MGDGADANFYYIYYNIIYIIIFYEHRGETEEGVRKTVSVSVIVSGDIRMANADRVISLSSV